MIFYAILKRFIQGFQVFEGASQSKALKRYAPVAISMYYEQRRGRVESRLEVQMKEIGTIG